VHSLSLPALLTSITLITANMTSASDWPWWRGPERNGVAAYGQKLPTDWSERVAWKVGVVMDRRL